MNKLFLAAGFTTLILLLLHAGKKTIDIKDSLEAAQ